MNKEVRKLLDRLAKFEFCNLEHQEGTKAALTYLWNLKRRARRLLAENPEKGKRISVETYRVYEGYVNPVGGVEPCGMGWEEYDAETAADAARLAADEWGWDASSWDGGNVIVATDDDGDSYHLHREDPDEATR